MPKYSAEWFNHGDLGFIIKHSSRRKQLEWVKKHVLPLNKKSGSSWGCRQVLDEPWTLTQKSRHTSQTWASVFWSKHRNSFQSLESHKMWLRLAFKAQTLWARACETTCLPFLEAARVPCDPRAISANTQKLLSMSDQTTTEGVRAATEDIDAWHLQSPKVIYFFFFHSLGKQSCLGGTHGYSSLASKRQARASWTEMESKIYRKCSVCMQEGRLHPQAVWFTAVMANGWRQSVSSNLCWLMVACVWQDTNVLEHFWSWKQALNEMDISLPLLAYSSSPWPRKSRWITFFFFC